MSDTLNFFVNATSSGASAQLPEDAKDVRVIGTLDPPACPPAGAGAVIPAHFAARGGGPATVGAIGVRFGTSALLAPTPVNASEAAFGSAFAAPVDDREVPKESPDLALLLAPTVGAGTCWVTSDAHRVSTEIPDNNAPLAAAASSPVFPPSTPSVPVPVPAAPAEGFFISLLLATLPVTAAIRS